MNNGNNYGVCHWLFVYGSGLFNIIEKLITYYYRYWASKPRCTFTHFNNGWTYREAPPVLKEGAKTFADPLPQALILTAIVISFGVTAFFLVLAYRSYQELETDDISLMRGSDEDE